MSASAGENDWREFRAKLLQGDREARVPTEDTGSPTLVPSPPSPPPPADGAESSYWVHELAVPEPGCVLLAQPHALLADQPVLHRAVVLVLEHDEVSGTVGLLLDTPTNATLGQLLKRRRDPRLQPLADNRLMVGGTVLPRQRLRVLTGRCDVPGSRKVLPGLYECSLDAAARLVAIGAADAGSFEIFAAVCQWSPDQLAVELSQALWLPVAGSSAAIRAKPAGKHALYFQLMEAVGGQYLRQAMLARTGAEVDEWITLRTRSATGSLQRLADLLRGRERLSADEAALRVHGLLYPRDNLTDVVERTESLGEQAAYIWFTRELEAGTVLEPTDGGWVLPERPLKDPSALLPNPKSAFRRRSARKPAPTHGNVDAPSLRVLSAAAAGRVSKENALLAVNLLLFDLLNFRARPPGDALPEQVRRGYARACTHPPLWRSRPSRRFTSCPPPSPTHLFTPFPHPRPYFTHPLPPPTRFTCPPLAPTHSLYPPSSLTLLFTHRLHPPPLLNPHRRRFPTSSGATAATRASSPCAFSTPPSRAALAFACSSSASRCCSKPQPSSSGSNRRQSGRNCARPPAVTRQGPRGRMAAAHACGGQGVMETSPSPFMWLLHFSPLERCTHKVHTPRGGPHTIPLALASPLKPSHP